MELAFLVLVFITGFLLGKILEKRRCQKKITQILDDAIKGMYKIRKVDKWKKHFGSL